MRAGIFFHASKNDGGGFQYAVSFLEALTEIGNNEYLIFNSSEDLPEKFLRHKLFTIIDLPTCLKQHAAPTRTLFKKIDRIVHDGLLLTHQYAFLRWYDSVIRARPYRACLEPYRPDALIFTAPSVWSGLLPYPSFSPIHDLHHLITPEFPEVSRGRSFVNKEYQYRITAKHAFRVLSESPTGKRQIMHYYGIPAQKIIVLKLLPPNYLNAGLSSDQARTMLTKYNLPENFIFYPAQFWPHKNHIAIARALVLIRENHKIEIPLVLTGGKKEEFPAYKTFQDFIVRENIAHSIHHLGYVDNDIMSALYRRTRALVMPTFFGPTNIPVLEAWKMECPVIYSSTYGCDAQLGDAGLLIDPYNPESIANALYRLWNDDMLRAELVEKGKIMLDKWTYQDFAQTVKRMLDELS